MSLDSNISRVAEVAEVFYPSDGITMVRPDRIDTIDQHYRGLVSDVAESLYSTEPLGPEDVIELGTYCTMPALLELADSNTVSPETVMQVRDNFKVLGEYYTHEKAAVTGSNDPRMAGFWAEIAVTKAIWLANAEGYEPEAFAILMGQAGNKPNEGGLRNDVDLRVRFNDEYRKIQVKLSKHKLDYIYEHGIKLMSPNQLVPNASALDSVKHLMRLDEKNPDQRLRVFQNLDRALNS